MSKKAIIILVSAIALPLLLIAIALGTACCISMQESRDLEASDKTKTTQTAVDKQLAKKISGRYAGTCSGQPMQTEFSVNGNGELTGHYSSKSGGQAYEGTLDHPSMPTKNTVLLTWHDKDGTGPVHLVFDEDGSSFQGTWKKDGSPAPDFMNWLWGSQRWDGTKSQATTEEYDDSADTPSDEPKQRRDSKDSEDPNTAKDSSDSKDSQRDSN